MSTALSNGSLVRPLATGRQRAWHDDERLTPVQHSAYIQGALALTYPLPTGVDAEPAAGALTFVRRDPAGSAPVDLHHWAARFVQAVVEVVSSDRPVTQLARWTSAVVYAEIADRQRRVAAHRGGAAVRAARQQVATVHVSRPSTNTAEVAARVCLGRRSRAVAARLELERGRWLCTAIAFG
jgi:Family of unknown function (DUF6459)